MNPVKAQWLLKSKIGSLYLVASSEGLERVLWSRQLVEMTQSLNGATPAVRILSQAVQQIEEYLNGARTRFDLPLAPFGTPFQQQVWRELQQIPYGVTYSYREIARRLKNEKAVRAVGTANGKNPLCIVVPCHRVITSNGTLGGYSGGLATKVKLLELETAKVI